MVKPYNIVIAGCTGSGKTSIAQNFYNPGTFKSYLKKLTIDGENFCVEMVDSYGQEEYSITNSYLFSSGEGFILVYSVLDRASFEFIPKVRELILTITQCKRIPMILVGTHCDCDLLDREVTKQDGLSLSRSLGIMFVEVSSRTSINISMIFRKLVPMIASHRVNEKLYLKSKQKLRHCAIM